MTETVLKQIVQRAVRDGSFRAQLRSDPAGALADYGLTADERSAVSSGDPGRLTALGVDPRISKMFTAGFIEETSKVVASDLSGRAADILVDEGSAGATIGDPSPDAAATDSTTSAFGEHLLRVEHDLDTSGAAAVDGAGLMERALGEDVAAGPDASSHLWQVEQDLDTGASVDLGPTDIEVGDVQIPE